ncbi:MAG: PorT family protein [Prevotellaceae bacterium]|jgi:hypothetical protein|nr:PorT family protein [Prevotellaceae bacterium]
MKKIFLAVVVFLAIGVGSASAQAVWGIRAGLSKPTVSGGGESIDGNFGLEVGPVLYYAVKDNFYINSGAMFSVKSFDFDNGGGGSSESLSMYYLDVPLNFGYSFPIGDLSFYGQAGPFIGIKLSESEESGLGSFNAGLGAMFGINLNKFKIECGYQLGLVNVLKEADDNEKLTLSSLFLGVSYVF